jgi:polar amino acid transport system substrate-binding protein
MASRTVFRAAALVLAGAVGIATFAASASAETTLDRIKRDHVLKIGFINEAPFSYTDADGKLTGEAVEIAHKVLAPLGDIKIEPVLTEWGSLIPGLKAGQFDIVAAGMSILPKRCLEVDFSEPTFAVNQSFVVKAGNPLNLHSYEDVAKNPKARLGVVAGSQERDYAIATKVPEGQIQTYPDLPSGLAGVQADRIDAIAMTGISAQSMADKAGPTVERATPFANPVIDGKPVIAYGAFTFRKEDKDLKDYFNAELAKFRGTPDHLALVKPFGFGPDEVNITTTTEELCKE